MATYVVTLPDTSGQVLYIYPFSESLADWSTSPAKQELIEGSAPDAGVYSATIDDAYGDIWYIFAGATQPTDWGEYVAIKDLSEDKLLAKLNSIGTGIVVINSPVTNEGWLQELVI